MIQTLDQIASSLLNAFLRTFQEFCRITYFHSFIKIITSKYTLRDYYCRTNVLITAHRKYLFSVSLQIFLRTGSTSLTSQAPIFFDIF